MGDGSFDVQPDVFWTSQTQDTTEKQGTARESKV